MDAVKMKHWVALLEPPGYEVVLQYIDESERLRVELEALREALAEKEE